MEGQKKNKKFGAPRILKVLDIEAWDGSRRIIKWIPFLLFLVFLGVIYIGNHHLAERNIRELAKTETELNQLRWEHVSLKSELDQRSKQSEVAKLVQSLGLKEITEPPIKIGAQK